MLELPDTLGPDFDVRVAVPKAVCHRQLKTPQRAEEQVGRAEALIAAHGLAHLRPKVEAIRLTR